MADDPEKYLRTKKAPSTGASGFDSKKWCWVPDENEGFLAGEIKSRKGSKLACQLPNGSQMEVAEDDTQQMNPPKFEKTEDMAALTYLNEASVLHNLRQRYYSNLIYTYSGLFCVTINPYRMFPIYTDKVVQMYRGKRRTEMPPHVFSIADNAYNNMIQDRENQSILITGESGAGKTENTKKVVQYFASVASASVTASASGQKQKGNLEDQVIRCNPLLEAFGNAKTIRNDNSSRFGKFIRIHFGLMGKIAGADIEHYLLEKSRVVLQQKGERTFHVFYQLLESDEADFKENVLLLKSNKASDYRFLSGGVSKVDSINDREQHQETKEAMDVLGLNDEEKNFMYKIIAAVLHFGNVQVKQPRRGECAEVSTDTDKVCHLLSVANPAEFNKGLARPRMKVGHEWIHKAQNAEKVDYDIRALSKLLYERMFRWLVGRINATLDTKERKNFFIGVLDIAGFEIFDFNSFEQLCINLTNEKLQQFFNHHMFIQEQEEYRNEGIEWTFIDFGLDLQPCIDLLEKTQGVLAILDEECLFPKATDKSFVEKLMKIHEGKSDNFSKPAFRPRSKAPAPDFQIAHYAGVVDYSASDWLLKNKDPQNDFVVGLITKSTNPLVASLFSGYISSEQAGKKKGGGMFQTVAQLHKESLNNLMGNLRNTSPHFVRCIIPNEQKKAGVIDAHLVLHQLRCNGVLEGIRICRKGFPNRLFFSDFKQRYAILAPTAIPPGFMDSRKAAQLLITALQLETNEYRVGKSKVFFRAGVLGRLEDLRDEKLGIVITQFQAYCRGFLMRRFYRKLIDQRIGVAVIQRNVRKHMFLRNWSWWKLFTKVKPLLNVARQEDEIRVINEELSKIKDKATKEEHARKDLEQKYSETMEKTQQLYQDLQREQEANAVNDETIEKQRSRITDLEQRYEDLTARLEEEEETNVEVSKLKRKVESELEQLRMELSDLQLGTEKLEQEKSAKTSQNNALNDAMENKEQQLVLMNKTRQSLEEKLQELTNALQGEEDKAKHLGKLKAKSESHVQELTISLDKEKKTRGDVEKARRKLEVEYKSLGDTLAEMTHNKDELQEALRKKGDEVTALNSQVESEQSRIAQLEKEIKALKARIEELEEDLTAEQDKRKRVEKINSDLQRELEELTDKLEMAGGTTVVQSELLKKTDTDLQKARQEYNAIQEGHHKAVDALRKKHAESCGQLEEKVDELQKAKQKLESEKKQLSQQNLELGGDVESLTRAKTAAEKHVRQLEEQFSEAQAKLSETSKSFDESQASANKLQSESAELLAQLEQSESTGGSLSKAKKSLEATLEDVKQQLDEAILAKNDLQSKYRSALDEVQNLKENMEEDDAAKSELQRTMAKVQADLQECKGKFESERQHVQDLENEKRKLGARATEAEEKYETLEAQKKNLEKTKNRLAGEVEDLMLDLEKAQTNAAALDKKQKKFDQQINEWKQKYEGATEDLEAAQREARGFSTELMKLKSAFEELEEQIDIANKENKHLKSDIASLTEQLGEGGKSSHDLEKAKKRVEQEKEELMQALEEAEGALEAEEGKVLRLQLETTQLKQEHDRRLAEKDEEIEVNRKNLARQIEALQESVEQESRSKNELMKQKKRVESELTELQSHLEGSGKELSDLAKSVKKLQQQNKDLQAMYDDEVKTRDSIAEAAARSERKCNDLQGEIEDLRATMEQTDRGRRVAEAERSELNDRLAETGLALSSFQGTKRKLEQQLAALQEEFEERESESSVSSEKLRRANEQLQRLQAELTTERETAAAAEQAKNALDRQLKDLHQRVEEAESNAARIEKKVTAKMEAKIRELQGQVEDEQKGRQDSMRASRKNERKVKELSFQCEEESKNVQRLQEQVDKLTTRNKTVRRQFEETDEQCESYKAKVRRIQSELDDALERAEAAEARLSRVGRIPASSRRERESSKD